MGWVMLGGILGGTRKGPVRRFAGDVLADLDREIDALAAVSTAPVMEWADPGRSVISRLDRGVRYAGFTQLPVADFDWPDATHLRNQSITIRNLGDVVARLHEDVRANPAASYKLYVTPGGVHAFNLGERISPVQFYGAERGQAIQADPLYSQLAQKPLYINGEGVPGGVFYVRTSPKVQRPPREEFIAYPVGGVIGGSPLPESRRLLSEYHDRVVSEELAKNGYAADAIARARSVLDQQVATVNAALRDLYGL